MKTTLKMILIASLILFPGYAWGIANWTVMIYMAADNDLEYYALNDFLELSSVGSSTNVKIVVQLDRGGYDSRYGAWTKAHRFYVTRGMTPTEGNAISNWGDGKGGREINTGDPGELKKFVEWAITNYPANNYLLVLWNHGQGWKNKSEKEGKEPTKWIFYDDTSDDVLWMFELKEALKGKRLSIVAMDACLMGTIEAMTELLGIADYFVGSEAEVPANGLPYNTIMSSLLSNPSMTPRSLCEIIVEKYGDFYKSSVLPVTISAIDMSKLNQVIEALDNFVEGTISRKDWNSIKNARSSVLSFPYEEDYRYQIDLGNFTSDPSLKSAIGNAVFKKYNSSELSNASGISIYFPQGREYNPFYSDTRRTFLSLSKWNNLLKEYLKGTAPRADIPKSDVKPNIDGIIKGNEWEDAYIIEKEGVKIYLKCDEKYIYIAVDDIKDSTLNINDRVGIYFDTNGDWSWPQSRGNEGNYWIRYDGTKWEGVFRAIWGNSGMPNSDENYESLSSNELTFATSLSTGHLVYEIRIDYTLRWKANPGDEVHLYIFAYDGGKNQDDICWPQDLTGIDYGHLSPLNYGTVKLGERIEIPSIEVKPEEIDFGEVKVDKTETRNITVKNVGTGTLFVEASLEGKGSSSFSISPASLALSPGESGNISVSFKPKRDESYTAYVVIRSNDPLKDTCYVYLRGEGKEEIWLLGGCTASGCENGLSYLLFLIPLFLIGSLSKKDN
ncbi:MAG: clostripain-related cysteine peptidase [Synergistetes bacterium]|nr:clostripain-related cysteine peptidase [Synergistota bacterium]MCX8128383.1 clostripain-related cysteine peptidase [Synergistota bacterium]MDW8192419.1 clostripain-related cysteine peptidase [Synergistota bacterium]